MTSVFLKGQIVAIPDEVVRDMQSLVEYVGLDYDTGPYLSDAAARLETFLRDIKEAALQDQDTTI